METFVDAERTSNFEILILLELIAGIDRWNDTLNKCSIVTPFPFVLFCYPFGSRRLIDPNRFV